MYHRHKDNWRLHVLRSVGGKTYGVASVSRLLKIVGLFCKRALWKRLNFSKETCNFKEPTHRSHPILTFVTWLVRCREMLCSCQWRDAFTCVPRVKRKQMLARSAGEGETERLSTFEICCCGALQCVAVCCSLLQCAAEQCIVFPTKRRDYPPSRFAERHSELTCKHVLNAKIGWKHGALPKLREIAERKKALSFSCFCWLPPRRFIQIVTNLELGIPPRWRGIVAFNFSPRNWTRVTSAMKPG